MTRYAAIIFDFDGVIVDSATIKSDAFAEIYRGEDPERIAMVVAYQLLHGGVSRRAKFEYFEREIFGRAGDTASLDALCRRYGELVVDQVLACPFIAGAPEFLERYCERMPLYLVSGTPQGELELIVGERSLSPFFRQVVGAPTTKPEAFAAILAAGRHTAHGVLAVGDSRTEFDAAHGLGMPFLAITPGAGSDPFPPGVARRPDLGRLADFVEGRHG